MQGYQCKCGAIIGSNSGESFYDCQGCTECNTTFAHHPDYHKELQPHNWKIVYNENTGKPYKRCKDCHQIDYESYKEAQVE